MQEHLEIEIDGDDVVRLKEIIDRAVAITRDSPVSKMCRVVRRACIYEGHAVVEFTTDSTFAERAQAACRFFSVAREVGVLTGGVETSDWTTWLDELGMKEENGEARAK